MVIFCYFFFFLISSCGFLLKSISSKREKKRHCINVNMKADL